MSALKAGDFQLGAVQTVLYTEPDGFSVGDAMRLFYPAVPAFDGDPQIVGHESLAMPPEIPRIFLHAKSGGWRCQIAPSRMDVFWARSDGGPTAELSALLAEATRIMSAYRRAMQRKANRVAAVVTRYAPHEEPGLFLARHFCHERWHREPLNRPESFELHAHKSYELGGYAVNSWFRAKSGLITERGGPSSKIVLAEQDLNTIPRDAVLSDEAVSAFFLECPREFDHILALYFPESL